MTILKSAIIISLAILIGACSQKTQETAAAKPAKKERSQQNRTQRGGGPPQFSELLSEMDTNKDGQISSSEVKGRLKNDFSKIDSNGDGYITEVEMQNAPKPERPKRN